MSKTVPTWSTTQREIIVFLVITMLVGLLIALLYSQDRRLEWRLRQEQATHRLNLADALISRQLTSVRSDVMALANQNVLREFMGGEQLLRPTLEAEFGNWVTHKHSYDQIRLLDLLGKEIVRVDWESDHVHVVPEAELQDKKDRYYVQQSFRLQRGEVFVSEFDLNQEHGAIERPFNPVIRFVTPVEDNTQTKCGFLVLNYLGQPLLDELESLPLSGVTMLTTANGDFVMAATVDGYLNKQDAWGWLIKHDRTFARQFPDAWPHIVEGNGNCILTDRGMFAARFVNLDPVTKLPKEITNNELQIKPFQNANTSQLLVISWLPPNQVFAQSDVLLKRLLMLAALLSIPLFLLVHYWALAAFRRNQQNFLIAQSEERLRELSSRMLRIQEEERRTISREIHDELGQQVTAINLDLKMAQRDVSSTTACQQLQRAIDENESLLATLHDFAERVRPTLLDDLGLHDAVQSHLSEFQQRTGIETECESQIRNRELPRRVAENVFRLVQESLNNVWKHADASRVVVQLKIIPAADPIRNVPSIFLLQVTDNGNGNAKWKNDSSRLGLVGMQERVDLLGGKLSIDFRPYHGTTIDVQIPLDPQSQIKRLP